MGNDDKTKYGQSEIMTFMMKNKAMIVMRLQYLKIAQ